MSNNKPLTYSNPRVQELATRFKEIEAERDKLSEEWNRESRLHDFPHRELGEEYMDICSICGESCYCYMI